MSNYLFGCVVTFALFNYCHCDNLLQVNISYETNFIVNDCIRKILDQQVDVTQDYKDVTLVNISDSLGKTLHDMDKFSYTTRLYFAINNTVYNSMYVVLCKSYEELAKGFYLLRKDAYWNPRAKFIIAIENLNDDLDMISNLSLYYNVFNVCVIGKDINESYTIYAFSSQFDSCNRPVIKTLQSVCQCTEFTLKTVLFPVLKSSSVRGCKFKLISHNYWPFMRVGDMSNIESTGRSTGIDRYVLNLFQKFEGAIVELVDYKEVEKFGDVYANYSHTEMLLEIEMNKVSGAVGGYMITSRRAKALTFLYPYLIDHYRLIVRRARLLDTWEAVMANFTSFTIFIIIIIFVIFCLASVQLSIFETREKDVVRDIIVVYGYLLNNVTYKNMKSGISHRIIVLNMLIFAIVMSCTIQASLTSEKTRPIRDYQVKTLEEMNETHQLIISPGLVGYMSSNPVLDTSSAKETCNTSLQCIVMVRQSKKKLYTIASNIYHDYMIYHIADKEGNSLLYKTGDSMGTILQSMLFRRGSTVLDALDKVIGRATDSGLLAYYLSDLLYEQQIKHHFQQKDDIAIMKLDEMKEVSNAPTSTTSVQYSWTTMWHCLTTVISGLTIYSVYSVLFLPSECAINANFNDYSELENLNSCLIKIIEQIQWDNSVRDVTLMNPSDTFLPALRGIYGVRFTQRSYYWVNASLYNELYIFMTKTYEELSEGINQAKKDIYWNPRAKFIITLEDLHVNNNLKELSNLLWMNNVFNASIIGKNQTGYMIYAFSSQFDSCHRPAVKSIQFVCHCSEFHIETKIFPVNAARSFRGCQFKLVTHNYSPFVSFSDTNEIGIEQYILKLLYEVDGIKAELIHYGEIEKFGKILDNFTHVGMLHEIETYKVEGVIGGYVLTPNRFKALSFVQPYMTDQYRIIVARADFLDKWDAVVAQFKFSTNCLVFLTFCVFCLAVVQLSIFSNGQKDMVRDIFIVYGYFLNNITHRKMQRGVPHRLIVLTMLIFVLILSGALNASLLSATTQPVRDYQVKTAKEVFETHRLILSPGLWDYIHTHTMVKEKEGQVLCRTSLACMMKVKNNKKSKLYTVASNIYHENIIWKLADDEGNLEIYKLNENIGGALQTILLRRGSSLIECFNKHIHHAMMGGLLEHHFSILEFKERLKYHFHKHDKESLKLYELDDIFVLLLFGYLLSIIVFILEYKTKN